MSALLKDPIVDAAFADFDKIFTPQHRYIIHDKSSDKHGTFREPTKDERYLITWAWSGDTDTWPYSYLGNGMFQIVENEDTYDMQGIDKYPFKVEPSEVECLEEIA